MLKKSFVPLFLIAIGWQGFGISHSEQVSFLQKNPMDKKLAELRCGSLIPVQEGQEQQDFIKKWAAYVASMSFSFNHSNMDEQLLRLQSCYTSSGWNQFNEALHKSGNLSLIKKFRLYSHTSIVGPITIEQKEAKVWSAHVPVHVVYQNNAKKITQRLNIHILINRLPNNHLGVMQIVGLPVLKSNTESSLP